MADSERMQLLRAEESDIRGRIAGLASRLEINMRMQAGIGRLFDGAGADSHGDTTAAVVSLSVPLTRPKGYQAVATLPVPLKRPIAYRPQDENVEKSEAAAVDLGAVKEELEDEELRKVLQAAFVADEDFEAKDEELQAAVEGGRCGNEDAEHKAGEAGDATDDKADEELQAGGDVKLEADEEPDVEHDAKDSKPQAAASGSGSARSRSPVRTRVVRVPPPLLKRLPPPASKARPKLHPAPPQKPPPLRLQLPPWRLPPPEIREWDEAQVDKWLDESNW